MSTLCLHIESTGRSLWLGECKRSCASPTLSVVEQCRSVMEVRSSGGRTTVVMHNFLAYCTLYCMCVITGWCQRGTAAAEADAVEEQQLKRMQSGHSSVWPRETSAHQRHYCTGLLCIWVQGCTRLTQMWWNNTNGSENSSDLCEELQVPDCSGRQTKGIGELDYWTGILEWRKLLLLRPVCEV